MTDDTKTAAPVDYAKIEADKKTDIEKRLAEGKKGVEERVAKAYEIETPTPTQEENDAAKLAAMGGGQEQLPEGSGWQKTPAALPAKSQPSEGASGTAAASKTTAKTSEAAPAASSYSTRSTAAKTE